MYAVILYVKNEIKQTANYKYLKHLQSVFIIFKFLIQYQGATTATKSAELLFANIRSERSVKLSPLTSVTT